MSPPGTPAAAAFSAYAMVQCPGERPSPPLSPVGTHYKPAERSVEYVPLGNDAQNFAIVSLDTGTIRPGLENVS